MCLKIPKLFNFCRLESLVKKDSFSTHTARVAETSYHDEKPSGGSERRVRFQSPLKASLEEVGKTLTANRDPEPSRTNAQLENRAESKDSKIEDKNTGHTKLNDTYHKMDYLNLCNTGWKSQSPKSGLMSRMEHSAYVDVSKNVITKGLPSFSKIKLPSSLTRKLFYLLFIIYLMRPGKLHSRSHLSLGMELSNVGSLQNTAPSF